jgi:NhaP-type Na+/H+ or K+/H+ antiporter
MAEERGYRTTAIHAALIGMGGAVGFVTALILFRVLATHGNDEAPGAGIFLLVAWIVLIPVGCFAGIAVAKLVSKYRRKSAVKASFRE